MRGSNPLQRFITEHRGPVAVVRGCACCKWFVVLRIGQPNAGRGFGMREGNKARGEAIQHVKHCPAVADAILKVQS